MRGWIDRVVTAGGGAALGAGLREDPHRDPHRDPHERRAVTGWGASYTIGGVNEASEGARGGGPGGVARWIALACVVTGCFRDEGPDLLCEGPGCVGSSSNSSSSSSTGVVPTTGLASASEVTGVGSSSGSASEGETTGAPVDTGITMRLDTMQFVDPHLFLADTTTDPNNPTCTADITEAVNGVLGDDIAAGDFNLLVRFEDFSSIQEVRVIDADCEAPAMPGEPRVCSPNESTPAVVLGLEAVDMLKCREIDPLVYAAANVPMINDPGQPCMRTKRASFSLAISGSIGALELREAQFVASLDDAAAPTRMVDGVLYGFLTKLSAENLKFEIPLVGMKTLWEVIDTPACQMQFPELLPSVDSLDIGGMKAPGVWLAINFTAERVLYQKPL